MTRDQLRQQGEATRRELFGDTVHEPGDETFNVYLTSPNASIDADSAGAHEFTIVDDDNSAPTFSIGNFAIKESRSYTSLIDWRRQCCLPIELPFFVMAASLTAPGAIPFPFPN